MTAPVPYKQIACLRLAAQGMSNEEIARELEVKLDVVRYELANVRYRLGARNTTHAVTLAFAQGLLSLEDGQDLPLDKALEKVAVALLREIYQHQSRRLRSR